MKKQLLTLFMMLTAVTASAQIVLWNGDDKVTGTDGGFWNRADPTVVEDGGNKVLKITPKSNPGGWDQEHHNAALAVGDINFKGLRRISFRIKMADERNVEVQLEGKENAFNAKRAAYYNTPNEWKTLVFEFGKGYESEKITDDNSNVLAIWPYEETAEGEGKTVYIDDIMVEGTLVGDALLSSKADASLTDQQIIVTGAMRKGVCKDLNNGWADINYNDFELLHNKISTNVCFLNLTGTVVSDGDSPQLRKKNPNLLILSPTDFFDTDNVIRWDGEKNITLKMVLDESYPFYTPIDFTATAVQVTRSIKAGINTMCLPFYVGQTEISTNCKIATYTSSTADAVNFTTADHADANVPFLATAVDAAATELNFTDKGVVNTPKSFLEPFIGIYAPQSAEGKYGINDDGKFQKGASGATVKSFHALMTTIPAEARSITIDGISTGINNISVKNPIQNIYNLNGVRVDKVGNKGIYIINGKKVIVK